MAEETFIDDLRKIIGEATMQACVASIFDYILITDEQGDTKIIDLKIAKLKNNYYIYEEHNNVLLVILRKFGKEYIVLPVATAYILSELITAQYIESGVIVTPMMYMEKKGATSPEEIFIYCITNIAIDSLGLDIDRTKIRSTPGVTYIESYKYEFYFKDKELREDFEIGIVGYTIEIKGPKYDIHIEKKYPNLAIKHDKFIISMKDLLKHNTNENIFE